jgi:hypothetical protein
MERMCTLGGQGFLYRRVEMGPGTPVGSAKSSGAGLLSSNRPQVRGVSVTWTLYRQAMLPCYPTAAIKSWTPMILMTRFKL